MPEVAVVFFLIELVPVGSGGAGSGEARNWHMPDHHWRSYCNNLSFETSNLCSRLLPSIDDIDGL